MYKILVEVDKKNLAFSLYNLRSKVENLNDTNIINTEKMVFSDAYIKNNIDLIKSFFNLIVLKNNIETVDISVNALCPIVFFIIGDNSKIKNVNLLEDKVISYTVFELLLSSKYIENVNCYAMPSFMFDKLDIDKNMRVTSRCEVLFVSNFMDMNSFNNYSDVYYKKNIVIDCQFKERDKEDIESFFRFNNNLKIMNLYHTSEDSIDYLLDIVKNNNKKNIKIILNQDKNDSSIIKLCNKVVEKNKKLIKNNNLKIKVNYIKEYRDKNMLKQVNLNFFRIILILFIVLAFLVCIIFFVKYREDTNDINDELDDIASIIDLNDIDNYIAEEEKIEEQEQQEEVDSSQTKPPVNDAKPDPYANTFDQIFSELLKINDETVGWLKVNNTNINYPVTKHSDNDYYLNNSYYKQQNTHGWVFMDYRNSIDKLDKNTIIYGHRNNKGLMFGSLKNVLDKNWYTDKNNQKITFNTLNGDMQWQIFSIYTLKNTNDYLANHFDNDESYKTFIEMIKKRSIYNFGIDVGIDDNILTLSTCYNNAEYRLVVHAKLIK